MIDGSSCSRMKFASLVVNYTILLVITKNVFAFIYLIYVTVFYYVQCFISFISYTSEPAKGTFILAAGGRSGTLFWGGSRGGENGGVPGGGGGGAGRGARGVGRAHV